MEPIPRPAETADAEAAHNDITGISETHEKNHRISGAVPALLLLSRSVSQTAAHDTPLSGHAAGGQKPPAIFPADGTDSPGTAAYTGRCGEFFVFHYVSD